MSAWPIFGFLSEKVGVDKTLLYFSHIQTTRTYKAQWTAPRQLSCSNASSVHFHQQADKMNHEARISRHSQNKSIIINQINYNS